MADVKPVCTRDGCPLQGQTHPKCTGHSKRTRQPCGQPPAPGQWVCKRVHGAKAKQNLAAGERRLQRQAAERELRRLFPGPDDPPPPRVDPTDALLDLIAFKSWEIDALRDRVGSLTDDELTWGRTREKTGGEDYGTTSEAKPNIWWSMLREAENQLATYTAAAHRAGIQDQQLQLAKGQLQLAMDVIRAAFVVQLEQLRQAGLATEQIAAAWQELTQAAIVRALQDRQARLEQDGGAT